MKAKGFQNNIGSNGWYHTIKEDQFNDNKLSGSISFDYVIVGAGFVGMAAAKTFAELSPKSSIALLDATKIGLSTSGRCSGFIIDTPHKGDLIHNDSNLHKEAFKINRKAIKWIENVVKKEKINCDWHKAGKYQVAASSRGTSFLEGYKKMLDNTSEDHKVLDKDELNSIFGTKHYKKAIFTPNCILFQPAAYLKGIAKAMPKNVTIYEDTRVEDIESTNTGVEIKTTDAVIKCKKVVLAVNIFAREFSFFKRRILPIITYASITKQLTEEQQKQYSGIYGWGLTSADKGGTTMRMTPDKRLVIRNHYTYTPSYKVMDSFITKIKEQHLDGLRIRYPNIDNLEIEHSWGGVCAVSRNFGFFAGELDKNIYSALGHNGVGAARGSIAGKALAEKIILGKSEDLDLISKSQLPCWNPPEPFLSLGISTRLAVERFKSRSEL